MPLRGQALWEQEPRGLTDYLRDARLTFCAAIHSFEELVNYESRQKRRIQVFLLGRLDSRSWKKLIVWGQQFGLPGL